MRVRFPHAAPISYSGVAQLVERQAVNLKDAGSKPAAGANNLIWACLLTVGNSSDTRKTVAQLHPRLPELKYMGQ